MNGLKLDEFMKYDLLWKWIKLICYRMNCLSKTDELALFWKWMNDYLAFQSHNYYDLWMNLLDRWTCFEMTFHSKWMNLLSKRNLFCTCRRMNSSSNWMNDLELDEFIFQMDELLFQSKNHYDSWMNICKISNTDKLFSNIWMVWNWMNLFYKQMNLL